MVHPRTHLTPSTPKLTSALSFPFCDLITVVRSTPASWVWKKRKSGWEKQKRSSESPSLPGFLLPEVHPPHTGFPNMPFPSDNPSPFPTNLIPFPPPLTPIQSPREYSTLEVRPNCFGDHPSKSSQHPFRPNNSSLPAHPAVPNRNHIPPTPRIARRLLPITNPLPSVSL